MSDTPTTPTTDPGLVAENVARVRDRIARAGGRDVRLVAVTKRFGYDAAVAAAAAGADAIGENYAQEMVAKFADAAPPLPLHFIGQLQTNKVRALAHLIAVYETVDRYGLVGELSRRVPGAHVLIQINATGEQGKGGIAVDLLENTMDQCIGLGLQVDGLMTVGPTDGPAEAARPGFRLVRSLVDDLELAVCSMGMSDDLEVAVEEGSTQVRIGSALFGPRPRSG